MQSKKQKLRNDVILIAAILLIAAIGLTIYLLLRKDGTAVVVTLDGEHYASYPLNEDVTVEIHSGDDQSGRNTLVISEGKAYVTKANCPDLVCQKHYPISKEGEAIVCLPNKMVVSIE